MDRPIQRAGGKFDARLFGARCGRCPLTAERKPSFPIAGCPTTFSPIPARNAAEYTVSEISGALRRAVEDQFGNVRVRGEISGYRGPHSSGHAYFALKDDRARHRSRGLAHDDGEAALPARRGHGGDRQRQAHHLSRLFEIPDRHRQSGAGRRRRADGAARGAQAQACRRRAVRCRRASAACPTCRASSASSPRRPAPSSATSSTASRTASRCMCWSGRCACRATPAAPR